MDRFKNHDASHDEVESAITHMLRQAWCLEEHVKGGDHRFTPCPVKEIQRFEEAMRKKYANPRPHIYSRLLSALYRLVFAERRFKRRQISLRKLNEAKAQVNEQLDDLYLEDTKLKGEVSDVHSNIQRLQWSKKYMIEDPEEDEEAMEEVD